MQGGAIEAEAKKWQFEGFYFVQGNQQKIQKIPKKSKGILGFSQRLAYVSARSKRNSDRARRALSPDTLKSAGRSSRRREKRQSGVGNDVF